MATGMSVYTRNKCLDAIFNNVSFVVAVPYISLHTADPLLTGANEATGGSYIRKSAAAAMAVAATGAVTSDVAVPFPLMPACTVGYFGVWDAATVGNFLWGGVLSVSKSPGAGDTVEFPIGDIDASLT